MLGVQKVMAGGPCFAIGLVAPYFSNEKWGNTCGAFTFMAMRMTNTTSKGAFHLSELTGQTIPNDNFPFNQSLQPDQSNPK